MSETTASLRPLAVLIVDESAMLRAMLKRVVQISGLPLERLLEAGTAESAIGLLQSRAIDVVFANVDASQRQGDELLRAVSEAPEWRMLVRVATSTRGANDVDDRLAALGVTAHLTTPFRPEAVREALAPLISATS